MISSFINILPLLLIIYFVVKKNARKAAKNKTAINKAAQGAKPAGKPVQGSSAVPPALSFEQAAPVVPGGFDVAVSGFDSQGTYEGVTTKQEAAPAMPEREAPSHTFVHKKEQAQKPEPLRPALRVIPEFSQNALVQAVVAKEILTRPPFAVRRFRPGHKPS